MNEFLFKRLNKFSLSRNNELSKPLANYKPLILHNNLIFVSGQLPLVNNSIKYEGKIGKDLDDSLAEESIKIATINLLWVINDYIREKEIKISKIRCLNLKGYLNCIGGFSRHSSLFNIASDLIIKVFGNEDGNHSRSVIGVNSLPLNSPVEIDGVFVIFS